MVYRKPDNEIKSKHYLANRERELKRMKEYGERNRERIRAYNNEYYQRKRGFLRARQNEYAYKRYHKLITTRAVKVEQPKIINSDVDEIKLQFV
jgi:hypothetical protein